MKTLLFLFLTLLTMSTLSAQREISANRISESIKIDGKLDEEAWKHAEIATDFTNWNPEAGTKPSQKSEFKIMYDDDAIYVGAYLKAESRADIKTELSQRDDIGNTDWIGVIIDTYGNGTEAAEFILTATGVQFDAKVTSNAGEDQNWNEVWFGEVTLTESGWYAELRIPYYTLRFPNTEVQNWKVNFMRRMAGTGEKCSFEYIDPEKAGFINQTANLKGINNIKSPLRLSLSPYVTTYYQHSSVGDQTGSSFTYSGGLDLKYGINEAFTLDMTLIPDFGQVRSDDRVLNLSPFEVRYSENRAFFTEGVDLFTKANLFYSRRVGGQPVGYWSVYGQMEEEEFLDRNPSETQLYNATKVSGRTKSGLGVGVFNAIAGSTEATITNALTNKTRVVQTAPLTNYNIVVLDQNLPNNSYVSLINTNVWRDGSTFHKANVTGTEFDLRTKSQNWGVYGSSSYSQLIFDEAENINGLRYNLTVGKISGVFRYSLSTSGTSRNYNHNDLGYFTQSNIKGYSGNLQYSINDSWWKFNRMNLWFNTFLQTNYDDNKFNSLHFNSGFWGQLKSQWDVNMWTNYGPESIDYFEARNGEILRRPGFYNMGWWIGSDSRKPFRIGINPFFMKRFYEGSYNWQISVSPRYRFSDQLSIFLEVDYDDYYNIIGYVTDDSNGDPVIGLRDLLNIENVIGARYTFNNKMSLDIRARHDWNKIRYEGEFYGLDGDGRLADSDYDSAEDFTNQFFNIDLNYTWRFAPGSDIIVVWKNSIFGGSRDATIDYGDRSYWDGVADLENLPQVNSISVRLVYFLNAQSLF